ncbi:MAG TPA: glycosyltransferase family 39 protein [Streptosporangiaceae bacterium]|nr:glycosyltransferase family 39 protein [Streptosporangiaceae bacterium]
MTTLYEDLFNPQAVSVSGAAKARPGLPRPAKAAVLIAVLAVQALLTVRLIPSHFVSGDEGRYLYAGHQLIYEFWHGGGSPYYETYFSGAPVLYPVLAAMADHLGGLVAVRLMSLAFMLAATALLYVITRRLFGFAAGVLAAALFAGLGVTQDLGALATYDALSLMLMTVAAYCAARTRDDDSHPTFWLLAVPVVLLMANAAKYMTVLFDPVVIALAALQASGGRRRILTRCAALSVAVGAALAIALALAGTAYLNGILFSTLARQPGADAVFAVVRKPASAIVLESWQWIGVPVAGSIIASVATIAVRKDKRAAAVVVLLMLAGLLVTLEGLHLHSDESMRKHDDFSAWFACAAAGSVASHLRFWMRNMRFRIRNTARTLTAVFVVGTATASGIHYSGLAGSTLEAGGPQVTLEMAAALRPYLSPSRYHYLLGGYSDDQLLYLDHTPVRWFGISDDLYIKYPVPGRGGDPHGQVPGRICFQLSPGCMYLEGIAGYRAAIQTHWFAVVSLWNDHHTGQDSQIAQAVAHTDGYVLLTRLGNAPTWVYAPDYPHAPLHPPGGG